MLANKKLSKYVYAVSYDRERTILYNSLNNALVLLENEKLRDDFARLEPENSAQLEKMGFMLGAAEADKTVRDTYLNFRSDILTILVELTQACNLHCPYCYQNDWRKTSAISDETLDRTATYIGNCLATGQYVCVDLALFGGEALLEQEKILAFYGKLKKLCGEKGAQLRVGIDTNAVLLTDAFLKKFDNIQVNVALTPRQDQDAKRPLRGGGGSYETVLGNLRACRETFNGSRSHTLCLRYNTDHENRELFAGFVAAVAAEKIRCTIKPAYTNEHPYNPYKNLLPQSEYMVWNSSEAIDVLVANGFEIRYKPATIRTPCTGYASHNLKIFSDGYLGLCNGYFPARKRVRIEQVCDDIGRVAELFPEKRETPFTNENCAACKELILCGGKRFCKQKPCDYTLIDLPVYLRTYVRHMLGGNAKYFDFVKS